MISSPIFSSIYATSPSMAKNKKESPTAKLFIGGTVAWTFELFGGHYMEVLKIAKQTSDLSYMQITRNMIQTKVCH